MDLTFTGRGSPVPDEVREHAQHKLSRLERLAPRVVRLELELVAEPRPTPIGGLTTIKGTLRVPRKTFHAHAEAHDVRTALDQLAEKLERQVRDHHGKRLRRWHRGVRFPRGSVPPPADTTG
jgi:ribosomal subunit interface protein